MCWLWLGLVLAAITWQWQPWVPVLYFMGLQQERQLLWVKHKHSQIEVLLQKCQSSTLVMIKIFIWGEQVYELFLRNSLSCPHRYSHGSCSLERCHMWKSWLVLSWETVATVPWSGVELQHRRVHSLARSPCSHWLTFTGSFSLETCATLSVLHDVHLWPAAPTRGGDSHLKEHIYGIFIYFILC